MISDSTLNLSDWRYASRSRLRWEQRKDVRSRGQEELSLKSWKRLGCSRFSFALRTLKNGKARQMVEGTDEVNEQEIKRGLAPGGDSVALICTCNEVME